MSETTATDPNPSDFAPLVPREGLQFLPLFYQIDHTQWSS